LEIDKTVSRLVTVSNVGNKTTALLIKISFN
jgi:hypothetical protein